MQGLGHLMLKLGMSLLVYFHGRVFLFFISLYPERLTCDMTTLWNIFFSSL